MPRRSCHIPPQGAFHKPYGADEGVVKDREGTSSILAPGGTAKRPSASAGCGTAYSGTFQELETVAEWVVNVHVLVARERLSVDDLVTGAAKPGHEGFQVRHQQARMRFPSWAKVGVNAKMNFHGCALEPNATAYDEMIGLRSLRNAQKARVEETSLLL